MAMKNDNSNSLETLSVNKSLEIRLVCIILTFTKKNCTLFIWNKSSKFVFFCIVHFNVLNIGIGRRDYGNWN